MRLVLFQKDWFLHEYGRVIISRHLEEGLVMVITASCFSVAFRVNKPHIFVELQMKCMFVTQSFPARLDHLGPTQKLTHFGFAEIIELLYMILTRNQSACHKIGLLSA